MATKPIYPIQSVPRAALIAILAVSVAAILFLFWLLYFHQAPTEFAQKFSFLPALNAVLNGLSAISLCTGFYFIQRRRILAHRNSMLLAFCFSSLFLVSYIVNHALHGDTHFPGHSTMRTIYLSILASHIILSIVALPLVLVTFFLSLTGRFPIHRRVARYTFPIWLYVSITGVVVFAMLKAYVY
jgi:putative membrane protein